MQDQTHRKSIWSFLKSRKISAGRPSDLTPRASMKDVDQDEDRSNFDRQNEPDLETKAKSITSAGQPDKSAEKDQNEVTKIPLLVLPNLEFQSPKRVSWSSSRCRVNRPFVSV